MQAWRDWRARIGGLRGLSIVVALAVALAACSGAATRPARAADPRPDVQRALNRLVKAPAALPGVVALVRSPSGTWRGAAGSADFATKERMRPGQRFRVGSVTKTFVATVVLQLVGEGKLRLGDTVERWLPRVLPYGDRITVRQLLNHTSGLYNYTDDPAFLRKFSKSYEVVVRPRESVALAAKHPLTARPGRRWEYSNTGYEVLDLIVEKVTGESMAEELARRIFGPLGLRATSFDPVPEIRGAHAHGYFLLGGLPPAPGGRPLDLTRSSGGAWASTGIVSNADDLARFFSALLGGRLLRPELLRAMKTTVAARPGLRYGLGLYRKRLACGSAWGHDGIMPGYTTAVLAGGDGAIVVVVAANGWFPGVDAVLAQAAEKAYCGDGARAG